MTLYTPCLKPYTQLISDTRIKAKERINEYKTLLKDDLNTCEHLIRRCILRRRKTKQRQIDEYEEKIKYRDLMLDNKNKALYKKLAHKEKILDNLKSNC